MQAARQSSVSEPSQVLVAPWINVVPMRRPVFAAELDVQSAQLSPVSREMGVARQPVHVTPVFRMICVPPLALNNALVNVDWKKAEKLAYILVPVMAEYIGTVLPRPILLGRDVDVHATT